MRVHNLGLIRKILTKYSEEAKISQNLSPNKLRHYLLTFLKKQGIDDALIQPYSGHESRKSVEIYSRLVITDVTLGRLHRLLVTKSSVDEYYYSGTADIEEIGNIFDIYGIIHERK